MLNRSFQEYRRKKFDFKIIWAIIGSAVLFAMIGIVVRGVWYKRQCDIIYNEVNSSVVKCGMKIHGQYGGEKVLISEANINPIIKSITDSMVVFASADDIPNEDPVILEFGDLLLMEIYPAEGYEVFVKHVRKNKAKYYYIKNTCNFNNLKKMVSLDQWSNPNIGID